jgi:ATP-dependent Clp protease ATP-binding subunit ClpC
LFDEGRITDAKGRTVDAGNCIIILTSNIRPAREKRLGFGAQDDAPPTDGIPELKRFFRPELLNRIDEQILFRTLDKEDIERILSPMLAAICRRLKDRHNITLEIDEGAKALLIDDGYKPEFGARELRRTVERLLEVCVAAKLLRHEKTAEPVLWRAKQVNHAIEVY